MIFNSDQGSQFTSFAFTEVLREAGVRISMDGRASYQDNIFTERFWRSVKYEEAYLKDYATIEEARASLANTSRITTPSARIRRWRTRRRAGSFALFAAKRKNPGVAPAQI